MKRILEIGLEGVADFKKSVLPIAPGVTYLYGYNALDNGNPNAAGKSVMASSTADIFYDTPMVGTKQDKVKGGTRSVKWKEGKSVHSVRSSFEGKTEKLRYRVNGVPAGGRTAKMTRELIRKAWGVTEEDYRTYGYLDSATPHPLVRGTSTARKAFFTSFFQLDKLDAERKILAKQVSELKKVRAQHTELDKTFQEIKQDMLSKTKRLELEARLKKLQKRLDHLRAVADEAQRAKSIADFRAYAKPHLKSFRALVKSVKDLDDVLKATRKALRKAEAAQEQAEEYEVYKKELKVWKRRSAELDMSKSDEQLEASAEKVKSYKSKLAVVNDEIESLKQIKEPEARKKPTTSKDKVQAEIYRLEHELDHLEKFKKGVCSECGQPVKVRKLKDVQADLDVAKKELRQWRAYEEYKELKTSWDRAVEELAVAKKKRKTLKDFIEVNEGDVELWSKRSKLRKPEKVDPPEDYVDPTKLEADLKVLEFFEPHQEMLLALEQDTGEVQPFDLSELDDLQSKISTIKAKLEVHETVKTRASKIRKRLQELEAQLEDEPALQLVMEAYSDKAVKAMAVEEISRRLMATVNKYAPIAFKGYTFEFVWGPQVRLLVHRPKGTTDVRKLSGAESKLFTLILVMSQLMFVPKSKRLSLLILDEPSASFSGPTLERFHRLLPHIQQLIPSILIVTPKSQERYEGAAEYTVVRNSDGAEIRKGHPDEIVA